MKIAFVYDAIYPWIKGGAEKRNYELGKRLAADGNEVHIFGVKWWKGNAIIRQDGIVLHGVCGARKLYTNGRRSITEAVIFSFMLPFHLIREKFDVIDVCAFPYFSCFSAKLVSLITKRPMIITWLEVWGDYWYEYLGSAGIFGKFIEKLVSRLAYRSIAISLMTKNGLESLGVNSNNIIVMPGGVDILRIRNIQPSDDKCDILFAGRLIKEKNVDVLLRAVNLIKKNKPLVKCHIIGGGPENDRLRLMVAELGLLENVSFSGFLDYDEVISRIKSSRMLVVPSGREGFGIVVIEAYACGIPVITIRTQRNAASELVDGTGFVVNLDPEELCDAILTLINDDEMYKEMSMSAINKVEIFDWDRIVKQLSDLYETIILECSEAAIK